MDEYMACRIIEAILIFIGTIGAAYYLVKPFYKRKNYS